MSDFKLEFTLKQHTPMIHFQSHQKGATLRATELKPKFDKFLIEHFKKEEIDYNDFLISGQEKALNYKVKIIDCDNNRRPSKPGGAYFARDEALKSKKVVVVVISFEKNLIEYIKELFEDFIVVSSFGSRNNKGFGSFSLESTDLNTYQNILDRYFFAKRITQTNDALNTIKIYYQELKSGINNPYKKSRLMEFLSPDILWEKRWIKNKLRTKNIAMFNDLKDDYHQNNAFDFNDDDFEKYKYIRPLLGMGYRFEFITKSFEKKNNEAKNERDRGLQRSLRKEASNLKLIIKSESHDKDLQRFKSPINFKMFEDYIYMVIDRDNPIDDFIFNKQFTFTAFYKKDSRNRSEHLKLGTLSTPKKEEFDLLKFLDLEEEEGSKV